MNDSHSPLLVRAQASDRSRSALPEKFALGCGQLGSVLGTRGAEAERLIETALEGGIRCFDTSNIYGQGESERILGRVLCKRREQVIIATKAGQHFPVWAHAVNPLKPILAPVLKRLSAGRRATHLMRRRKLPQDFSYPFLKSSLEASLRRLKTDHVEILLLHSPSCEILSDGSAIDSLRELQLRGRAQFIGVGCEDIDSGLRALEDDRVQVVEAPLWPWTDLSNRFVEKARRQCVLVIGRGLVSAAIASAATAATAEDKSRQIGEAVRLAAGRTGVHRILFGTKRIEHLRQILGALQS